MDALEDIGLDDVAGGTELLHQVLHLVALGAPLAAAGGAVLSETAGALDEMELVIVAPCFDVLFLDLVHGADQLHTLEILAMKLGHHSLDLAAVEHPHQYGLDHIIKMMSQSDLITAQGLGLGVQVTPAHAGTEVTGIAVHTGHDVEDLAFEDGKRNAQYLGVVLNDFPVIRIVARVHHQEYQFEGIDRILLALTVDKIYVYENKRLEIHLRYEDMIEKLKIIKQFYEIQQTECGKEVG